MFTLFFSNKITSGNLARLRSGGNLATETDQRIAYGSADCLCYVTLFFCCKLSNGKLATGRGITVCGKAATETDQRIMTECLRSFYVTRLAAEN